jgi:hypothetical protein
MSALLTLTTVTRPVLTLWAGSTVDAILAISWTQTEEHARTLMNAPSTMGVVIGYAPTHLAQSCVAVTQDSLCRQMAPLALVSNHSQSFVWITNIDPTCPHVQPSTSVMRVHTAALTSVSITVAPSHAHADLDFYWPLIDEVAMTSMNVPTTMVAVVVSVPTALAPSPVAVGMDSNSTPMAGDVMISMNVWPILTTVIRPVLTLWVASTVDVTLDTHLPQMEGHALIPTNAHHLPPITVSRHALTQKVAIPVIVGMDTYLTLMECLVQVSLVLLTSLHGKINTCM